MRSSAPPQWLPQALDGLGFVRSVPGVTHPAVLAFWPAVTTNPYQRLVYGDLLRRGIVPVGIDDKSSIDAIPELHQLGARTVFHLHWTTQISALTRSPETAARNNARFLETLDRLRAAGTAIMWTIHNVVPHGCLDIERELTLQSAIAQRCDVIHVLGQRSTDIVSEGVALPRQRIRIVPHPSYRTAYPAETHRDTTRAALGIPPTEVVYAVVGSLRRNKGLAELLDAYDQMGNGSVRPVLIIAGTPLDQPTAELLRDRARRDPVVKVFLGRIEDDQLVSLVDAADVMVLPYQEVLNSGVLFLAWSRGRPVVGPAMGELADQVVANTGVLFDPDDPGGLARALADAWPLVARPDVARAIERALVPHNPGTVATTFGDVIQELVEQPPTRQITEVPEHGS